MSDNQFMYSIILITYNEEKYIFRALESIRYQIESFGAQRDFQLIIADDCSKDETTERIEFWLERYGYLFKKVDRLYQRVNVGTCHNISGAIRLVEGNHMFVIGGDDLFSNVDVFGEITSQGDYDVLASIRLVAYNDQITKEKRFYNDALAQAFYTPRYFAWATGLGCPGQVGMTWSTKLNTEKMLAWMERYRLMDDRARYYSICRVEHPIRYKFIKKPLIIYYKNQNSVSNLASTHVNSIRNDLINFYQDVYDNSASVLYKVAVWFQKQSVRLRGQGALAVFRYFTPYYLIEQTKRIVHYRTMKSIYNDLMKEYFNSNKEYFLRMNSLAESMSREYLRQ